MKGLYPKLLLLVTGLFFVLGVAILAFVYVSESRHMEREGLAQAEALNRMAFEALYASMRQGGGREDNRQVIERLRELGDFTELHVVRGDPMIQQFGAEPADLPQDELDRRALAGEEVQQVRREAGYRVVRYVSPLPVRAECQRCHQAPIGEISGVISTEISLKAYEQTLRWRRTVLLLALGGGLLALGLLTFYGLRRVVIRPLQEIRRGAAAISQGDLGYRLQVRTGDELAALAGEFNRMAVQLQESYTGLEQKVARRTRELSALYSIADVLARSLDLREVLNTAFDNVLEVMDISAGGIYVVDQEAGVLELTVHRGLSVAFIQEVERLEPGQGVAGRVAQSGEPIAFDDVSAAPEFIRMIADKAGGVRSLVSLPLKSKDRVLGVMNVVSHAHRPFTPDDVALLTSAGRQIAVAIERAQLYAESQRAVRELTALLEGGRAIGASLSLEEVLDNLLRILAVAVGVDRGTVFLLDADGQTLRLGAIYDYRGQEFLSRGTSFRAEENSLVRRILQERKALTIEDVVASAEELGLPAAPFFEQVGARSLLVIPLRIRQRLLGIVGLATVEASRTFSESKLHLAQGLADQAAIAVENARLYQQVREQRVEEQAVLLALSQKLLATLDLKEMLDHAVAVVSQVLRPDFCALALPERDGETLVLRAARGWEEELIGRFSVKVGEESHMGYAVQHRMPVTVDDYAQETRFRVPPIAFERSIRSGLAVPMLAGQEVVGAMIVHSRERHHFSEEEVRLLSLVANQTAIAVENVRLFEERRARAGQLVTLNEIAQAVSTLSDLDQVLETIYQQTRRIVPLDAFFIGLVDRAANRLNYALLYDMGVSYPQRWGSMPEGSSVHHVAETGEPFLINRDPEQLEALSQPERRIGDVERISASLMYAPLLVGSQVIGVISAQSYQPYAYTRQHLEFVQGIASHAAIAIQNARLFTETRQRAEETAALLATARAVSTLELDAVLNTIAGHAKVLLRADGSRIHLLEPDGETLRCAVALHQRAEQVMAVSLKVGQGMTGRVALKGVSEIIPNTLADPDSIQVPGTPVEVEAMALIPLKVRERVTGVMTVSRLGEERPFVRSDVALLTAFADQAAVAIENARMFEEIQRRLRELSALFEVSSALRGARNMEEMLPIIVDKTTQVLGADTGLLLLLDDQADQLVARAGCGQATALVGARLPRDEKLPWRCLLTGEPHAVADVGDERLLAPEIRDALRGMACGLCAPLHTTEKPVGVMGLGYPAPRTFSQQEVRLLTAIADMAGNAIHRAALHEETVQQAEELAAMVWELEETYSSTLVALSAALDARDRETEGHSQRVTVLTLGMAEALGVPQSEWVHIERGSLLHDVGKIGISDSILHKPGDLNAREWALMRKHPEIGHHMLKGIGFLENALDIVLYHHERYDGRGYPRGLAGEGIPLAARIFAVADAYDAMTSHRPYRAALSHQEALAEIRRHTGTQFDPHVVEIFLQIAEHILDITGGGGGRLRSEWGFGTNIPLKGYS